MTAVCTYPVLCFSPGLDTYHIDELNEGKTELNIYFLRHVLHGSDQLIVPSEQVPDKPFFVLRAPAWNKLTHLIAIKGNVQVARDSRGSAVNIAAGHGLDGRRVRVRVPVRVKEFHFPLSFIPALGPTQPHIQWVPGALSRGSKAIGA
jgi:hypothetical protein